MKNKYKLNFSKVAQLFHLGKDTFKGWNKEYKQKHTLEKFYEKWGKKIFKNI